MILRWLQTLHYRNLEAGKLGFEAGITGIVGGNGQGKTNLLEAIFLCLTGVLEVGRVETSIRLEQREAHVAAEIERNDGTSKLEVGLAPGKKLAKVDGVRVRTSELARHASAVLIRPEDSDLVHGSPAGRRAFLDGLVSRMSPRYAQALQLYERTLTQRNAVLRHHEQHGLDGLEIWDQRLIDLGSELMRLRRRAVGRLNELAHEAHNDLAGNQKSFELHLLETAPIETFANQLQAKRREELARGTTACGPHRDDLDFRLASLPASDYASRGEARTLTLALRKAEFDLLSEKFGEAPVLLIDDFTAELDTHRRGFLLELAANTPQAIITGTETPAVVSNRLGIQAGQIRPLTTQPITLGQSP